MRLSDIENNLQKAIDEGQVGEPVALRMHLRSAQSQGDVTTLLAEIGDMAERLFGSPPERVLARGLSAAESTALVSYASGATLMVTFSGGLVNTANVSLLLIGNHGIANLDSASWSEEPTNVEAAFTERWREMFAESAETGKAATAAT